MAHFAQIDENNIVLQIIVIPNEEEHRAEEFILNELNLEGRWIQTSYNTRGNIYFDPETNAPSEDQSKAFRKNYAGIGYYYDEEYDGFFIPKPFPSWTMNTETWLWESPVPIPETGGPWEWNEELGEWQEATPEAN